VNTLIPSRARSVTLLIILIGPACPPLSTSTAVAVQFCVDFATLVAAAGPDAGDLALEKRVQVFARDVRCLVCQNETLADSQADLAADLRREIREQMKAGRSDEQIKAFLTERYGDFVLYRPPLRPSTVPLWFGPFVLAAGGFWALYRNLK
jgi:cytochrome c-type biogenesis protein CcmH